MVGSLHVLEVIASSVERVSAYAQDFHVLCVEKLEQAILPSLKLEMENVFWQEVSSSSVVVYHHDVEENLLDGDEWENHDDEQVNQVDA